MTMLLFPDLETLQLALTLGAVPSSVAQAPAEVGFAGGGAIQVRPSAAPSRSALAELRRLGVRQVPDGRAPLDASVCCWPQILPVRRDPSAAVPDEKTPVFFDVPDGQLPGLVGEILRLGNDRQSVRWLADGDGSRALLRVVGPPYYALLRALDRGDRPDAPVAFVERAPRVLVEVGHTHPLVAALQPPPGRIALLRAPRAWEFLDEGKFRDVYDVLEFHLPAAPVLRRDSPPSRKLTVPLRLARGGGNEAAELWVLTDRGEEQLDTLVSSADDRLLARLAFAVGTADGQTAVVLRVRPSKQAPPVLVLDGVGYRPYLRLPNLFLPTGLRLHPPLRRDAVARLLAADSAVVTWLTPRPDGRFVPESLPDEAFRPLDQWVDYVLDREHRPLRAWVEAHHFDFEPFVCPDEAPDRGKRSPREKARGPRPPDEPTADPALDLAGRPPKPGRPKTEVGPVEAMPALRPGEALRRLGELEDRFLGLTSPLDAEERQELWRRMAPLNEALERVADATICRANAVWEQDEPPPDWATDWARAEAKVAGRTFAAGADLDRLLDDPRPSPALLRALTTALIRAAAGGGPIADLAPRMGRLQHLLVRHEGLLPVRVAWLTWAALARLAGGDALMLARARDRFLERLHRDGLGAELDLPGFLRYAGGDSGGRLRAVRDHLLNLHGLARAWAATGDLCGPHTGAIIDLFFAFGLARLGDAGACAQLQQQALAALRPRDPVLKWLGQAFDHRIRQVLEGKAAVGPLPEDLLRALERMEREPSAQAGADGKINRYKVDRLRQHSAILEPHEKIDPYRHWQHRADELTRELAALADLTDREALAERLNRLLGGKRTGPRAASEQARVVAAALEMSFRLGEAFARKVLGRVLPAVEASDDLHDQARLLEKGLQAAAHFDQTGQVQAFVARFDDLLRSHHDDPRAVQKLEPLLGQSFRGLRKLGMRDQIHRLLGGLAELVLHGRGLAEARRDSAPGEWASTLKLLLHVASGWFYFGKDDRAAAILDEARALLVRGDLARIEQTSLACGYIRTLAHAPASVALPRLEDLFRHLERVHDTFTTNSHYSLSRLDVAEAAVLALVGDEAAIDQAGRRWLDDDEYFVRRRIHRDVRRALGPDGSE